MARGWIVQRDPDSEKPDETDRQLTQAEAEELAQAWKAEKPESVVRILRCPRPPSEQGCEVFKVY